jgi:hypothetical protein
MQNNRIAKAEDARSAVNSRSPARISRNLFVEMSAADVKPGASLSRAREVRMRFPAIAYGSREADSSYTSNSVA